MTSTPNTEILHTTSGNWIPSVHQFSPTRSTNISKCTSATCFSIYPNNQEPQNIFIDDATFLGRVPHNLHLTWANNVVTVTVVYADHVDFDSNTVSIHGLFTGLSDGIKHMSAGVNYSIQYVDLSSDYSYILRIPQSSHEGNTDRQKSPSFLKVRKQDMETQLDVSILSSHTLNHTHGGHKINKRNTVHPGEDVNTAAHNQGEQNDRAQLGNNTLLHLVTFSVVVCALTYMIYSQSV